MLYKYNYTPDGIPIMVEVSDDVAAFLLEDERLTSNADRKERYHCISLDALEFEGDTFAYYESPERVYLRKEEAEHIRNTLDHLTETQFRRLMMRADGLTETEIAEIEGTAQSSVSRSLEGAKKNFKLFFNSYA